MSLVPGARFGRYVIRAQLGAGGMGQVFEAKDTRLDRVVALKVLAHGDEARILREARAAAAIEHPNVARVFEVGEEDGVAYLAMELVRGRTLRTWIGAGDATMAQKLAWLGEVASALAAAHARDVIHRDVKPENVLVSDEGVAKVLDFGIAEPAARASGDAPSFAGTRSYMAPEQRRGEALDGRADEFAWGVMAYELFSGQRPWSDESVVMLGSRSLAYDAPPLGALVPSLAPEVEAIVTRAIAPEREERFASMEAIAEALTPIAAKARLEGAPTVALPQAAQMSPEAQTLGSVPVAVVESESVHRTMRGRRARLAGWGIALAAAIAVAVAAIPRAPRVKESTAQHPEPAPRIREDSAMSPNAEATNAYRTGMQAIRDASREAALASFLHATELDPGFAAAHLRYVVTAREPDDGVREHARQALARRQDLSAHDRVLLDAYLHWTHVPQDARAAEQVLTEALARGGEPDADFAYHVCRMRTFLGDFRGAVEACEGAVRLDPSFADALQYEGMGLLALDENEKALRVLEGCLDVSPTATSCLRQELDLYIATHRCDELVRTSRRLIALDPSTPLWFRTLAYGLFGLGESKETVLLALAQEWQRRPPARRPLYETSERAMVAIFTGDFVEAEKQLLAYDALVATSSDEAMHLEPTEWLVELYLETGRTAEAARIADAYAKRRAAWTPPPFGDTRIQVARWRYHAGVSTRRAFVDARDAWLRAQAASPTAAGEYGAIGGVRWCLAYALPAISAEDGRDAMRALPDYLPLPATFRRTTKESAIGRAYLLGGEVDEAIRTLRSAASSCGTLPVPFEAERAALALGQAMEAKGLRAEACDAYAMELRWWPKETRARSSLAAAAGRARLHCDAR